MVRALAWSDLHLAETIGEGQSASVLRAHLVRTVGELQQGAEIALKVYKPWVLQQAGQIERIFREVDAGRRVEHPHVAKVYGAVLTPEGRPALAMRLYRGSTLASQAIRTAKRSLATTLSWLRDIASGLSALHESGIIHRDIKPANVILTDDGAVIADFGVIQSAQFPEQTTTGAFLGTIRYAAPEYLFGHSYDQRIDTYSFGALAYELFSGREFLASHRHWAQVIVAKSKKKSVLKLPESALIAIADVDGWNAASFAEWIVRTSCCPVRERVLDLNNLADAINEKRWTESFVIVNGKVQRGWKEFNDTLKTAQDAARIAGTLSDDSYNHLRAQMIAAYHRGYFEYSGDADTSYAELLRSRLVGRAYKRDNRILVFVPALKEAFALGLLSPRNVLTSA